MTHAGRGYDNYACGMQSSRLRPGLARDVHNSLETVMKTQYARTALRKDQLQGHPLQHLCQWMNQRHPGRRYLRMHGFRHQMHLTQVMEVAVHPHRQ